jgi:hypothetical protein
MFEHVRGTKEIPRDVACNNNPGVDQSKAIFDQATCCTVYCVSHTGRP